MSATSPPEGAMRADARRNRQRLIEAALAAFAEHGADDASLDEIARRAGVGIGTLYRHFPTRQALLEAVYRSQVEALCARAQEYSAQPGTARPARRWPAGCEALVAFAATKRNLTISMMSSLGGKNAEVVSSCSAMVREAVVPLLARAQQAGEIRPGRGRDRPAEDVARDLGRLRVPVRPFRPGPAAAQGDARRAARAGPPPRRARPG